MVEDLSSMGECSLLAAGLEDGDEIRIDEAQGSLQAGCSWRKGSDQFGAKLSQKGCQVGILRGDQAFQALAQPAGKGRAGSTGRDGNGQIAAAQHGWKGEITVRRVVHHIDQAAGPPGLRTDPEVDLRVIRGGNDEESTCQVSLHIGARNGAYQAGTGQGLQAGDQFRADDLNLCAGLQKGLDFAEGYAAATHYNGSFEIQVQQADRIGFHKFFVSQRFAYVN